MATQLWTPSAAFREGSNLHQYMSWLAHDRGLAFDNYHELWNWSVADIDAFWKSLWDYFDIQHDGRIEAIRTGEMPHCEWFTGTRLSFAEHVFRKRTDTRPAIVFGDETGRTEDMSWKTLTDQVTAVQAFLKQHGVGEGDRVAAYIPAIPEATIAFLAVNSIGAIWSSCSPDFGTTAVSDRFAQIEPKILIATSGYRYNGKTYSRREEIVHLLQTMPSVKKVVIVGKDLQDDRSNFILWNDLIKRFTGTLTFTRVPFNHPIWIMYSSGTTGKPKAIVHSTGGMLLEHLKYLTFHNDVKSGDRCFWYTTTGWMMWNYIQSSLLCGGILVLYDGSPAWPDLDVLWRFAETTKLTHFGTSAGFIMASRKAGKAPGKTFDLSSIRSIGSTGSTLPPEGFEWVYESVKDDVWLASISGGTDVCSAFVGGNPLLPVYDGEIQCRALGCRLETYNEAGQPITNDVGEMVITAPMPCMPVYFWNDPDFNRYRESYFEHYPGVWRHGDWVKITEHNGVIIYGRSDATLNRAGIRIGTSEIYRAVELVSEVKDSLIICIEKDNGSFWMPLFVALKEGVELTDELRKKINTTIRSENSPRHVPDEIIVVPDIPYTISGKKTEMPVKKIFMGSDPEKIMNQGALRNPESIDFFVKLRNGIQG